MINAYMSMHSLPLIFMEYYYYECFLIIFLMAQFVYGLLVDNLYDKSVFNIFCHYENPSMRGSTLLSSRAKSMRGMTAACFLALTNFYIYRKRNEPLFI